MGIGLKIQNARRQAGLTQEQLAARVYVTRQAVSRWETGESEPGIDMRKLLARVLDVPIADLLDLPDAPACQCCGAPFDVPNMPFGTNADGTENPDYCMWCYKDGEFTGQGLDEIIERNVPYLVQATGYSEEEAVSFMGVLLPTLKRWSAVENRNIAANLKRGAFYVCPDCANVVWSAGEAAVSCCGNALAPLAAKKSDGILDASVETEAGLVRVSIDHPMTKENHLLFIAAAGDDLVRIKRLYPEQEARAEFWMQGPCTLYAYGINHGLVEF
ncbi:MAG: helix-turn-helix domain-containing protein [Eggerthellaceae bacterium]|nr:helix-turn-helix domain-containing protein [Eggerthellaceae bacterium]